MWGATLKKKWEQDPTPPSSFSSMEHQKVKFCSKGSGPWLFQGLGIGP